jgi:hypothetical protein
MAKAPLDGKPLSAALAFVNMQAADRALALRNAWRGARRVCPEDGLIGTRLPWKTPMTLEAFVGEGAVQRA